MLYRELREQAVCLLKETPPPRSPEQFDTPEWDARLLLEHASGLDRTRLFLEDANPAPPAVARRFRRYIRRRAAGEPIAYIIGTRSFYELEFEVTPAVLIPRADTETLVEAALAAAAPDDPIRLLDLCTGSGCVAASVKNARPRWEVAASDISAAALKVARRNFRKHHLEIKTYRRDLLKKLPGTYDIITANPPYISEEEMHLLRPDLREPETALTDGRDGLSIIYRLLEEAPASLKRGGRLFIEAAPHQMKNIRAKMEELCYNQIGIRKDAANRERVIYGNIDQ